jgi:hypothetical protein
MCFSNIIYCTSRILYGTVCVILLPCINNINTAGIMRMILYGGAVRARRYYTGFALLLKSTMPVHPLYCALYYARSALCSYFAVYGTGVLCIAVQY